MKIFFNWLEYLKSFTFLQVFTIYLRYLIGGSFVFASIIKILGERFTQISVENPIGFFFEAMYRTGLYWQFIGWAQLIGGLLLMTQYFSALGAMVYFIVILNIFVITYSLAFVGTPFITFLMLMGTVYLIFWDWQRFLPILTENKINVEIAGTEKNTLIKNPFWSVLGLVIFLTTVAFQLISFGNFFMWMLVCFLEGLAGFVGYFLWKRLISKKPAVSIV